MRFVRLLKDTPDYDKGDIFYRCNYSYVFFDQEDLSSIEDYDEAFPVRTVEDGLGNWFEEITLIAVKPFNAEKLQEVDELADQAGDIIQPFHLAIPNIGVRK